MFPHQVWEKFHRSSMACHGLARVIKDTWCENAMVLAMSFLVAIMEEQVKSLQSMGENAWYTRQDPGRDDEIAAGKYFIL